MRFSTTTTNSMWTQRKRVCVRQAGRDRFNPKVYTWNHHFFTPNCQIGTVKQESGRMCCQNPRVGDKPLTAFEYRKLDIHFLWILITFLYLWSINVPYFSQKHADSTESKNSRARQSRIGLSCPAASPISVTLRQISLNVTVFSSISPVLFRLVWDIIYDKIRACSVA